MGDVIELRPMSQAAATRHVCANLSWDRADPATERRLASSEARQILHHDLNDRIQLLRVLTALARSPLEALAELQRCQVFASHPAGMVDLGLFEGHLFGAASGGVDGPYGRAYLAQLAAAGPYVASIH